MKLRAGVIYNIESGLFVAIHLREIRFEVAGHVLRIRKVLRRDADDSICAADINRVMSKNERCPTALDPEHRPHSGIVWAHTYGQPGQSAMKATHIGQCTVCPTLVRT